MNRILLLLILSLAARAVAQNRPQPRVDLTELEQRIHELVNEQRAAFKLRPLKTEERLREIARLHSADMAQRRFFDHINPDGKDPTARGRDARYICRKFLGDFLAEGLAENLFQNNLYNRVLVRGRDMTFEWNSSEDIAISTVEGWMKSPAHRRAILTDRYDRTGIGVVVAPNDQVLITQLFC
jgi:uncharacterized protein YkwD